MDFEFQSIKLDKELVWGIGSRKMGMPIVQTLLVFAQRNHIWVTAEGIETREQAAQLENTSLHSKYHIRNRRDKSWERQNLEQRSYSFL